MKGILKEEYYLDRKLFVYLPPSYGQDNMRFPVLYAHDGNDLEKVIGNFLLPLEEGFEKGSLQEFIWVGIYPAPNKRQHEYTPWPAPALVEKFEDFGGQGDSYIQFVSKELKTYMDTHYHTLPEVEHTWLMGYSLGGLISIYSTYSTSIFGKVACVCGSFWYQDAVTFVQTHKILNETIRLFISYGKAEGKGKATIQQYAVQCTEKVIDILKQCHLEQLEVIWDEGGHHHYREKRYQEALMWLARR